MLFISSDGDLTIKNSELNINRVEQSALFVRGNVSVENSELNVNQCSNGADVHGNIAISGSTVNVTAGNYGIKTSGAFSASGGELNIKSLGGISADSISLSDVKFDITAVGEEYSPLTSGEGQTIDLTGGVLLYGADGKLLFEGEWNDGLVDEENKLSVEGIRAARIVSAETADDDVQGSEDDNETSEDDVVTPDDEKNENGNAVQKPEENDKKTPDTGDDTNAAIWIALLVMTGAAAAGIGVFGRKRK